MAFASSGSSAGKPDGLRLRVLRTGEAFQDENCDSKKGKLGRWCPASLTQSFKVWQWSSSCAQPLQYCLARSRLCESLLVRAWRRSFKVRSFCTYNLCLASLHEISYPKSWTCPCKTERVLVMTLKVWSSVPMVMSLLSSTQYICESLLLWKRPNLPSDFTDIQVTCFVLGDGQLTSVQTN